MRVINQSYVLIIALVTSISACMIPSYCVRGEGEIVSEKIDLPEFHEVRSIGSVDVVIKSGSHSIVIKGYQNVIDSVELAVKDNVLLIDKKDGCYINTELQVVVTVPLINIISVMGSGDINIKSLSGEQVLEIQNSGSGDIELYTLNNIEELHLTSAGSGDIESHSNMKLKKLNLQSTGSGDVDIQDYQFLSGTIKSMGSGDVAVWITDMADLKIMGSGDINLKGNPKVTIQNQGSGELNKD